MVDFKKTPMTKEQAEYVRKLRVDLGYSHHSIAAYVAAYYPEMGIKAHTLNILSDGRHQHDGMDLCAEAAEFFGENAGDEPWN